MLCVTQGCNWSGHSHWLLCRTGALRDTLVSFLGQCYGVVVPGEVLADVHFQEYGAARFKSTTISFVFCLFRERLLFVHHQGQGVHFALVPTTVANLTKRLELCVSVQLWVSRVRKGLSTLPWAVPMFGVMVLNVFLPTHTTFGVPVRKSNS